MRRRGWGGGDILEHRALRVSPVRREKLVPAALLALALFVAYLLLLGPVARAWVGMLEYWRGVVDIPGSVSLVRYDFYGLLEFDVPFMSFASGLPGNAQWWWGLALHPGAELRLVRRAAASCCRCATCCGCWPSSRRARRSSSACGRRPSPTTGPATSTAC